MIMNLLTIVSQSPLENQIHNRRLFMETKITISTTSKGNMAYLLIKMEYADFSSRFVSNGFSEISSSLIFVGGVYARHRIRQKITIRNNAKLARLLIQV